MSYILLTNKETYATELNSTGIEVIESYNYFFFEKLKATYSIAKVLDPTCKITITEKGETTYVNQIPVKFFEAFDTIEAARQEIRGLVGENSDQQKLVKVS